MFRISLFVCVLLVAGVAAKPWKDMTDEAFQETVVSLDENGELSWPVEVEPPEDKDILQFEIDPRMKIWKSMTVSGQDDGQPQMAEEDMDELNHPSVSELLQEQGFLPVAEMQEDDNMRYKQEAEQDEDDMDHPDPQELVFEEPGQDWEEVNHGAEEDLRKYLAPLVAEQRDVEPRGVLYEPETDEDDLYHQEYQPVQMEKPEGPSVVRVHLQAEEDLDDIYHKDLPLLQQDDTLPKAAGPDQLPSQRKYTEPEEDLDDLYHQ